MEYFQAYGSVVAKVKRDEHGNSMKYGMVQFDNDSSAAAALNDYESHSIQGKWIEVKPFGAPGGAQNGKGKGKGKGKSNGKGKGKGYAQQGYAQQGYAQQPYSGLNIRSKSIIDASYFYSGLVLGCIDADLFK